jgi:hypothetical protein
VLRAVITSGKSPLPSSISLLTRSPPPLAGITTLHFESGGKSEGKDAIAVTPKYPCPSNPDRALPPADPRPTASSSSLSLIESLRIVASIAAAPLSVDAIVERYDAAAIELIGCMRTRLFLPSEIYGELLDEDAGPRREGGMCALQAGAPATEHPVAGCAGACLRTQQPLVYNDIATATDFVLSIEGCGPRAPVSQAFAPVSLGGSLRSKPALLGVLQVLIRGPYFPFGMLPLARLLPFILCRS